MRELLRQIQRVEQLSPAIHWHGNLSDSDMGRDLLVNIYECDVETVNALSCKTLSDDNATGFHQRPLHRGQEGRRDAQRARQALGHDAPELRLLPCWT